MLHILFWLVLCLWFSMIVSPGVAAISAFTQLPEQGAMIPTYTDFFENDQEGMGRMVAGYVTDPIFLATDMVQWFLAPAALLLAILMRSPLKICSGPGQYICIFALAGALGLVILHNTSMGPRMTENLQAYREAAGQDLRDGAESALAAFEVDHEVAEPLFGIRLLLLAIAIAGAAGATRIKPCDSSPGKATA